MAALSAIAGAVGLGLQAAGTIAQGQEERARFQYEQKVRTQQAAEAKAASQRAAAARTREGQFAMSRQRAAIAASGGSLADPSVLDMMGDTAQEVDLAARTELYKGEQQARGFKDAAKVSGVNAQNAVTRSGLAAAGTLFGGISSMYSRFGQNQRRTAARSPVIVPYG